MPHNTYICPTKNFTFRPSDHTTQDLSDTRAGERLIYFVPTLDPDILLTSSTDGGLSREHTHMTCTHVLNRGSISREQT